MLSFNLEYLLRTQPEVKRIVDVGCGVGEFLAFCENREIETYGMEISSFAIEEAKKRTKTKIVQLDVSKEHWPLQDNYFDAVVVFDVLEHVISDQFILREAYRVLREGGVLFCTTPNNQGKLGKFLEHFMPDDPTHINKKNAAGWFKQLHDAGFHHIDIKGTIFHGMPPSPALRGKMKRYGLPVSVKPFFFPITFLCGTLYITAKK